MMREEPFVNKRFLPHPPPKNFLCIFFPALPGKNVKAIPHAAVLGRVVVHTARMSPACGTHPWHQSQLPKCLL